MKYDTSNSGYLSLEELTEALRVTGFDLAKHEIEQIMKNADSKENGRIDYSEFIAATL